MLAGVGRLHEVVSGAGFGGMAGLNAVKTQGIEDVDVSEIVGGKANTHYVARVLTVLGRPF